MKDSEIYPKYSFRLSQSEKEWLEKELSELKEKFNNQDMGEFPSISKSVILLSAIKRGIHFLKFQKKASSETRP